jgi:hypothetical protein
MNVYSNKIYKKKKERSPPGYAEIVIEVLGEDEGVGADIRVFGSVRLQRVQGGGGGRRVCVSIGVGI